MEGKRGQGLSLTTIILIILGIAVLVFLIYGFSVGWANLWGKINPFATGSNIDSIKNSCILSCSANEVDNFCHAKKAVRLGEEKSVSVGGETLKVKQIVASCDELAKGEVTIEDKDVQISDLGLSFDSCPTISCSS